MTITGFLRDRIYICLLHMICAFFTAFFLSSTGTASGIITILMIFWILVFLGWLITTYLLMRRHFNELFSIMNSLDKRYLFSEVIDRPKNQEGQLYYELMRKSHKSMIENVSAFENQHTDYKEYIEQWIHEIKLPIASAKLICENHKDEHTRRILSQLERIDNDVERALYYARLGYVANDYLISEIRLSRIVSEVIARNKQLLISEKIQIETHDLDIPVLTDSKWIEFILNQVISNSIKYRSSHPHISIYARQHQNVVVLYIEDNGIGVKPDEIGRIFQKGFTGSNGRSGAQSTGFGLYLCKKLCERLNMDIQADSAAGQGLTVRLIFPLEADIDCQRFLSKM